jgi:hypothetical protein
MIDYFFKIGEKVKFYNRRLGQLEVGVIKSIDNSNNYHLIENTDKDELEVHYSDIYKI